MIARRPHFHIEQSVTGWQHRTAEGERIYAIGDVHGEYSALRNLLRNIDADLAARQASKFRIIFLGDLVDRGVDSRAVLDHVIEISASANVSVIAGNHESMLLDALADSKQLLSWRQYGGLETLASFGVSPLQLMRGRDIDETRARFQQQFGENRRQFLEHLLLCAESGDYFFCHAGIRPGRSLSRQSRHDLTWIRDEFLASNLDHGKIIIHGHTPVSEVDVRKNRINIDTGAYLSGTLSCLVLEDRSVALLSSRSDEITSIL